MIKIIEIIEIRRKIINIVKNKILNKMNKLLPILILLLLTIRVKIRIIILAKTSPLLILSIILSLKKGIT
jgi:hypothetical protein